jgi:hypothetical protein
LSLAQLATHCGYFGHGAVTMSLEWGINLGEKENGDYTVCGPKAYILYGNFSFKSIVTVMTKVLGEQTELEFPGLA